MPSSPLLREVADYCWSHNFLDVFHKFFEDHAHAFVDAPPMTGGEHNMVYYDLFQKYLVVYEETLTDYLSTLDVSIEEFYREVRDAQEDTTDPYMKQFIKCLLASADYDSFYRVMAREGKKAKNSVKIEDFKAESKYDSKAADVDDDVKGSGSGSPTRQYESKSDYK